MNPSILPPKVELLARHVAWLRTLLNASVRHSTEFAAKERAISGDLDDWQLSCTTDDLSNRLSQDIADARRRVVRIAERVFAPSGAPLQIADGAERPDGWERTFDVARFWGELAETYSAKGADLAFGDVARRLNSNFSALRSGEEIKTIGGCPVLSLSSYGDSWGSGFKVRLSQVLKDFAAIGESVGCIDEAVGFELKHFQDFVRSNRGKVTAHQKFGVPGLFVAVLFNSKVDFRLSPAFVQHLQLFIARYSEPVAQAA